MVHDGFYNFADYLAAKSDAEHYASEGDTELREVETIPSKEKEEVEHLLLTYGLEKEQSTLVVKALRQRQGAWIDHDALGVGIRKTGSQTCTKKRPDHWSILHSRWPSSSSPIYVDFRSRVSPHVLSYFLHMLLTHLWMRQRSFHWCASP